MNENIDIDVKGNETSSSSTTTVNTPLVGISVKTETNNGENNSQHAVVCESDKISICLSKKCYWQWLLNEILSFSTLLFIVAIGSILVSVFCIKSESEITLRVVIAIFALLSLIFSVVTRFRNDDTKWIKRPLLKSIVNGLNSKELNKERLENLLKILEM